MPPTRERTRQSHVDLVNANEPRRRAREEDLARDATDYRCNDGSSGSESDAGPEELQEEFIGDGTQIDGFSDETVLASVVAERGLIPLSAVGLHTNNVRGGDTLPVTVCRKQAGSDACDFHQSRRRNDARSRDGDRRKTASRTRGNLIVNLIRRDEKERSRTADTHLVTDAYADAR
jgi:hypothetical protein